MRALEPAARRAAGICLRSLVFYGSTGLQNIDSTKLRGSQCSAPSAMIALAGRKRHLLPFSSERSGQIETQEWLTCVACCQLRAQVLLLQIPVQRNVASTTSVSETHDG